MVRFTDNFCNKLKISTTHIVSQPSPIMSSQIYLCSCLKPFKSKVTLTRHASKTPGCNPAPIAKKRKDVTSPAEDFLDSLPDIMKDSLPRWCREDRCFKDDLGYGIKGDNKIACNKHNDGLFSLGSLCTFMGCVTKGTLKIQDTRYKFCKTHLDELIEMGLPIEDIKRQKNKRCAHEGCNLCPSFDGNTYCEAHSPTGISDDKRTCDYPGCHKTRPTFGFPGQPRTKCSDHKEYGMYSRKLCIDKDCTISASYGPSGGVVSHCKKHKIEGHTLINNRKCDHENCDKQPVFGDPATGDASYCKTHAPEGYIDVRNKRCIVDDCDKLRIDSTMFCVSHGGGKTCTLACCTFGGPRPQYGNPDDGTRICAFGARALMEEALLNNDIERSRMLMAHFNRKTMMVLNQQSAFRTELEKIYWKMLDTCAKIYFDETVSDKPKTIQDLRPDIFYLWEINGVKMAIHIEYDEGGNGHEDDDDRLRYISDTSGTTGNVYVIRIDAKATGSSGALCTRSRKGDVVFYTVSDNGRRVASKVADAVIDRIQWIEEGLGPDSTRPAKVYF